MTSPITLDRQGRRLVIATDGGDRHDLLECLFCEQAAAIACFEIEQSCVRDRKYRLAKIWADKANGHRDEVHSMIRGARSKGADIKLSDVKIPY